MRFYRETANCPPNSTTYYIGILENLKGRYILWICFFFFNTPARCNTTTEACWAANGILSAAALRTICFSRGGTGAVNPTAMDGRSTPAYSSTLTRRINRSVRGMMGEHNSRWIHSLQPCSESTDRADHRSDLRIPLLEDPSTVQIETTKVSKFIPSNFSMIQPAMRIAPCHGNRQ